jgi:hypothetical protein
LELTSLGSMQRCVACEQADLESAKEDLQRTHTELAAVQAEANRFSLTA